MDPNNFSQFLYYCALFSLTIAAHCAKSYRNRKDFDFTIDDEVRRYIASYTFFGFELVNVSAGVFIFLSHNGGDTVGFLFIIYTILVFGSTFFQEKETGTVLKVVGNLMVALCVSTVVSYAFFFTDQAHEGTKPRGPAGAEIHWKVALPYMDSSLNFRIDAKNNPVVNYYVIEVAAKDRYDAIEQARVRFYQPDGPAPYSARSTKTEYTMPVIDGKAVVERL